MMVVHKDPRWERSLELVGLEVAAMERCRANPFLILAELNDAMLELMMVSMRGEREIEKEKFLGELRKVLNAGRRDL
jgi:hypothetical protein